MLADVVRVEFQTGIAILYRRPNRNHPKYLELLAMIPLQGVSIAFGMKPPPMFPLIPPTDAPESASRPSGPTSPELTGGPEQVG